MTIELEFELSPNRAYRGGSCWHSSARARGDYRYDDSPWRRGGLLGLRLMRRCS